MVVLDTDFIIGYLREAPKIIKIYAKISADLRKKGEIIGDYDELIASITIHHNEILITRNLRHYEIIPNLSFQNWEKL